MDDAPSPLAACPQCGTTMPAATTGGVCPRCLLREALQAESSPSAGNDLPASATDEAWSSAATIPVSAPAPSVSQPRHEVDLPLPEELTALLPPGAYLVEGFLGQGGMGAVYKGVQVRLKRAVAIKIMRRDLGKDMDFEARFEREAQAMAKLNHPNIVSVIDFGEAGADYLYIVMELVDGADLMDVIRGGQMTQQMALSLLPQICDALQFAHDHGIVHRDIKPSNIMLTRDGRIKMADFGLAKRYDAEDSFRTQTGTGMGTPDYAAPEQFDPRANIDHRADIYALGVMIYQMITGQLPRGAWKAPSLRAEVDPHWDEIVSRAMQSDPSDRYQQASEVKTDVSSILLMQRTGAAANPPDKAGAATPKAGGGQSSALPAKSRAALFIGILGCLVAVIAAGLFFGKKEPQGAEAAHAGGGNSSHVEKKPDTSPIEARWKPLFTEAELAAVKPPQEYKDGALRIHESKFKALPSTDGAIRAKIIYHNGAANVGLGARITSAGSVYKLRLSTKNGAFLEYLDWDSRQTSKLASAHFQPVNEGDVVQMELRIEGRHLTGLLNGRKILEADDDHLQSPGSWGVFGDDVWFQSIEIQQLPLSTSTSVATHGLPEAGWKALVSDKEWQASYKGASASREFKDGLLHVTKTMLAGSAPFADGAVRAKAIIREDSDTLAVIARRSGSGSYYKLGTSADSKELFLNYFENGQGKSAALLSHVPLPSPLRAGDKLELELQAQGNRLVGRVNGAPLIDVRDDRLSSAGTWGIHANDGWFESCEVQPLPAAEPWQDLMRDPAKVLVTGAVEQKPEGLLFAKANQAIRLKAQRHDGAIRLRAIHGGVRVVLQAREKGSFIYRLFTRDDDKVALNLFNVSNQQSTDLRLFPLREPLKPGQDYELELRVVGDTLAAKFNGEVLGTVTDGTVASGTFGVVVLDLKGAPTLVKSLEVLDLDKPAAVPSSSSLTFNGHRYQRVEFRCTWPEAKTKADAMGGHLATFTTEGEELWARDHLFTPLTVQESSQPGAGFDKIYWLGAHVAAQSRELCWLSGEPVGKLRWHPGNPDWRENASIKETQAAGGPLFAAGLTVHQPLTTGEWAAIAPDSSVRRVGFIIEWDDAASPSPTPPASKSSQQFPPGQWVKLFTQAEDLPDDLRKPNSGVTWEDGWIRFGNKMHLLNLPLDHAVKNVGVRVTVRRQGTQENDTDIILRRNSEGTLRYQAGIKRGYTTFGALKRQNNDYQPLWFIPLAEPYKVGDICRVEFAAIGSRLVGRFNETVFKSASDVSIAEGFISISSAEDLRDIEVINLDGLPAAEALRLLGVDEKGNDVRGKHSDTPGENWQNLLKDTARLNFIKQVERTAEGLRLSENSAVYPAASTGSQRDAALRVRTVYGGTSAALRMRAAGGPCYQLNATGSQHVSLMRLVEYGVRPVPLKIIALKAPLQSGQEYELELRVIGQTLTARLNGEVIATVSDGALTQGNFGIAAAGAGDAVLVKTLEFLDLDKPAPSAPDK